MVEEKCCWDTGKGFGRHQHRHHRQQQHQWPNEGRCGEKTSGNSKLSKRSVKYWSYDKKIGASSGVARGGGAGARGKGASDSKLASEKQKHDGSRGARTRRHRGNGGGSLSSRGSAATGVQCGLCTVLASLFRRAMCIAGSRRGSGESCYQELATEMQQHHQPRLQSSQQFSHQRSPAGFAGSPLKTILPNSCSTSGSFDGSNNRLDDESLGREKPVSGRSSQHDDAVFVRICEDTSVPAVDTPPVSSEPLHPPPVDTELSPPDPRARLLSEPDFILIENLDNERYSRARHTGRFLTMHKRRRKRLITRSLNQEHALLDDIFHGQVQCMLMKANHWRFNAFTLETVTGGRSLSVLCVHLFQFYGLFHRFNLDVVRAWKLFALIEEGYHSTNPYHNSIHATDVTQAMHCFLQEEKIKRHLSSLEIMASLIAAVTHDLDHPGVNQPFLVATSNHLATLYENTSVLENHHWRSAIGCLLESGVSEQLPPQIRPELERHISSLILATDITRQQEFLTRFKASLDGESLNMDDPENRHFILQISLKCADISNPCRPWDISRKWSYKVCEEFFRQGDYERKLNLPVTPLCDRQSMSIPRIQAGFFEFVVTPLYEEWHRFLGDGLSVSLMSHLRENRKRWEALIAHEAAEETRTEVSDLEQLPSSTSTPSEGEEIRGSSNVGATGCCENSDSLDVQTMPAAVSELRRPSLPGEAAVGQRWADRRHSVPLSVSKLFCILPMIEDTATAVDTAISANTKASSTVRRESLPSERNVRLPRYPVFCLEEAKLVDEALREMSSLSLISSKSSIYESAGNASLSSERPVSAENLLPEPSIASITSSAAATRLSTVLQSETMKSGCQTTRQHLTRQQTFPPLQPYVRIRYMSTTAEMSKCQTEALIEADDNSLSSLEDAMIAESSKPEAGSRPAEPFERCPSVGRFSLESSFVENRADSSRRPNQINLTEITGFPTSTTDHPTRRHSIQTVSTEKYVTRSAHQTSTKKCTEPIPDDDPSFSDPEKLEKRTTRKIELSELRRHSLTPLTNETDATNPTMTTTSSSSNYLTVRRFTAIPLLTPVLDPTKKFFIGTPPGSPPRLISTVSSSSESAGSDPRPLSLADFNEAHPVGVKRDGSDNPRQKSSKIAKLADDAELKENFDPKASGDESNKSCGGGGGFGRRNNYQGWARRRGSAPVGLLPKVDDSAILTVAPRTDLRNTRRGSVPTDIIGHQDERDNFSSYINNSSSIHNNNHNNNKINNKKKSNNNGSIACASSSSNKNNNNGSQAICGRTNNNESFRGSEAGPGGGGGGRDFGLIGSPRRGSVPADISELRRDLFGRNSVNGKTRNRKKVLRRRSSGGPEMFSGRNLDDNENGKSSWKKEIAKREPSIPEPSIKRRGSLPVEMVPIFHPASAANARRSSLWRL
ncbi:uncharacterized protein [Venturia canescens]|uniref:uncharacterized protein n=1 Tax=Venturia canescens TaxID=32260 RepID=UPI001C9BF463|nr:uncharacterized protein LOC122412715 [Venturia canescens]XP_043278404.1 uncharacterized protein LOC122412715 [Venturia canescens]XP_043278405.1 uncharacterized protein LOC122412715 [Venturia canescens]XP_043278407.1 uncharacterized protein LOC122412715 [Venturia canescens]XP_043278408.1 uncharacterized protein LOC122412715 [Venturia canescens]XP_043278409.1 uncharacterized protein LOC122412715 [Venturia canescens]